MNEILAYDRFAVDKQTVRHKDENGFLHVDISPVTREQVAPYYGHEIPNYKELGFESDEIYHGYRSADELKRPTTIQSLNGIPIQLEHHADYADEPAKSTRVGATGTDAQYKAPFLTNSLHFYDQKAIDRIEDGSMKELSLGYRYTPIKKSGEWNGQKYDFLMTQISCNHLALVEEGRAGRDVCVGDSQIKQEEKMPNIEKAEVGLAQAIIDLHEQTPDNDVIDKTVGAPKGMDSMTKLLEALKADGIDLTKYQKFIDDQPAEDEDLTDKEDPAEDVDEINEEPKNDDSETDKVEDEDLDDLDGEDEGDSDEEDVEAEDEDDCDKEAEDEDETETEDDDKIIEDALKECGLEDAEPAVKKAFARGFKFESAKDNPADDKKTEGKEELGQDHAIKSMTKKVERSISSRFNAADECAKVLGRVKPMAFDSAGAIYRAALEKMGVKGAAKMKSNEARSVFRFAQDSANAHRLAEDKAIKQNGTAVSNILNKIKIGV